MRCGVYDERFVQKLYSQPVVPRLQREVDAGRIPHGVRGVRGTSGAVSRAAVRRPNVGPARRVTALGAAPPRRVAGDAEAAEGDGVWLRRVEQRLEAHLHIARVAACEVRGSGRPVSAFGQADWVHAHDSPLTVKPYLG